MSAKTKNVTGTKKPVSIKILGVFALAMINVAAVLSIRNFPSMAEFGWSSIGWYIIGTILFLIPISLAGAELATGWPEGRRCLCLGKEGVRGQRRVYRDLLRLVQQPCLVSHRARLHRLDPCLRDYPGTLRTIPSICSA